ncbi:hypothetical protein QQ045_010356 [Rhodiola kirilowii]
MLSIRDYEKMNFGMKGLIVQTINLRNYLVPLGNCLNMSDFKVKCEVLPIKMDGKDMMKKHPKISS